jgi:hypothetical protein
MSSEVETLHDSTLTFPREFSIRWNDRYGKSETNQV